MITPYPAPENLTSEHLDFFLENLRALLVNLPNQLPEKLLDGPNISHYASMIDYQPDSNHVEMTGCEASALNMHFEHLFGHMARTTGDGILPILERGTAVCAIHSVLREYCTKFPHNNILKKWVIDVSIGAEKVYGMYNVPIPGHQNAATIAESGSVTATPVHTLDTTVAKRPRSSSSTDLAPPAKVSRSKKPEELTPYARNVSTKAGRKPNDLLNRLVNRYQNEKGSLSYSCIAPACTFRASGNVQRSRVLKHASKCGALKQHDLDLFKEAVESSSSSSLGSQLDAAVTLNSSKIAQTSAEPPTLGASSFRQATLDLAPLRAAGKRAKAEENKHFQHSVDQIIMRLICVRGLVPTILDSPEWKELMTKLNGVYKPSSSNLFRDTFIPQESVYVQQKMTELLKKEHSLTLTFDGNTIRRKESFYTVHATTPARRSFFLDAHEGSGVSHNREWITKNLMKTIEAVGVDKWAAIVSDNTNVTKAARRDTILQVPTMIDLWDCVHHIQNTIKDITNLAVFKNAMKLLKGIIKYFSKSSFGTYKLREARLLGNADGPVNSLQTIGKTRFGTHWIASTALDPCLPYIRDLVIAKTIKFKNTHVQSLFATRINRKYTEFSEDLLRYSTIVAPLIRALWSLEAAHANAADVLIFWLAIAAMLKDLFEQDVSKTGISRSLANEITMIYNSRYEEFFRNDIYFVALLLDPRYPSEQFLKLTISIPCQDSRMSVTMSSQPLTTKYPRAYERLKEYMRTMLKTMLERIEKSSDPTVGHPVLRQKGAMTCVLDLKQQLEHFWNGEYPFRITNGTSITDPLAWWTDLSKHEGAQVLSILATRIFSILVNSMPDERTNSTITWFNTPLRGNQQTANLADMIKVGQWYGQHNGGVNLPTDAPQYRPAVKFRKIDQATLEKLQTLPDHQFQSQMPEGFLPTSDSDNSVTPPIAEDFEGDSDDEEGQAAQAHDGDPKDGGGEEERVGFVVDPQIDINSRALIDMISVEAVVPEEPSSSARPKSLTSALGRQLSVDEAFSENW